MATLYHSGTAITMDEAVDTAAEGRPDAVLTDGDRIVLVGDERTARERFAHDYDDSVDLEEIDLNGQVLMPSFVDAHGHFLAYGTYAGQVRLGQCTTVDQIVDVLTQALADRDPEDRNPLVGVSYDHNSFATPVHPNRHDLDRISDEGPRFHPPPVHPHGRGQHRRAPGGWYR